MKTGDWGASGGRKPLGRLRESATNARLARCHQPAYAGRSPECRLSLRERTFFRGAKGDYRPPRRGASLVEILVVISVMSIIMSAVAISMHGMYRADRAARRELQSGVNLARLTARLRADVHAATAAEVQAGTLSLELGESRTATYTISAERVERVVKEGDKITHQDAYQLFTEGSARWQVAEQAPDSLVEKFVVLTIERSEGQSARIEARLAADHRFEKRAEPAQGDQR